MKIFKIEKSTLLNKFTIKNKFSEYLKIPNKINKKTYNNFHENFNIIKNYNYKV